MEWSRLGSLTPKAQSAVTYLYEHVGASILPRSEASTIFSKNYFLLNPKSQGQHLSVTSSFCA